MERVDPLDREEVVFRRLKGEKKHYCPDWDFMAIDETCVEFECCTCFGDSSRYLTHLQS